MYVYIGIYVRMYVGICMYVQAWRCDVLNASVRSASYSMYVCMCACVYVCLSVCLYTLMHVCACMCVSLYSIGGVGIELLM